MHRGGGRRGRGGKSSAWRYVPKQPQPQPTTTSSSSSGQEVERNPAEASSSGALSAPPPASSRSIVPPLRPGYGVAGRKCTIFANHFLVTFDDSKDLHQYDVVITPEVASKSVNRKIMERLVTLYQQSQLGGREPAYDGRKSLFTAGCLPFESKQFAISLTDEGVTVEDAKKEREFKVTIRFVRMVNLHRLQQFLQGMQRDVPQETIQAFDIVLREIPSKTCSLVARSFFPSTFGCRSGSHGLDYWEGYYQSLRPTQMGLSLNIDISAAPFYKPIPVMEFVMKYLRINDSTYLSDIDRVKIKKALRGVVVETIHKTRSCRRYKITGITSSATNKLMFHDDKKGTSISVVKYFKDTYGEKLHHVTWPCLQAGSDTRSVYLPMQLCRIIEGQRYSKKLNEKQVIEILDFTCNTPNKRKEKILTMVHDNTHEKDASAKEFGMTVSKELVSVQARVLPSPLLKYHESGKEKTIRPADGQWSMIHKKLVDGGKVRYWACLNFSQECNDVLCEFFHELVKICQDIGMVFHDNPLIDFKRYNPDNVEAALKAVHTECTNRLDPQGVRLQLLIVILPVMSGLYGKIKRICETELDIVSQCCMSTNVKKKNKQVLQNLALKINVKVGGRNTVLADALQEHIPSINDEPTIIFGADVTHPSPGEDASSSIAAVVASMDWPHVSKYRCSVVAQSHRQEMIQNLFTETEDAGTKHVVHGGMIRELLIAFNKSTNQNVKRIIFYRDGVSEGQFNQVLQYEMSAIRKACASIKEDFCPKITFIVVQKRHHTRFFPDMKGDRNVLPGTVVDRKICHPQEFDFYLCSHAGIKGTIRPTHYHVLCDENRFTADELQKLTHNLCYTYARCTRSVSLVPPAYYAHLAAFRARYYMDSELSDSSSTASDRGGSRQQRSNVIRPFPELKENVKNVMFFC